jgi:hypothetical protein
VYSQKLLLSDYGRAKMWVALKRDDAISSLLLLAAAPWRRPAQAAAHRHQAAPAPGELAVSPRRSTHAEAALRPLRVVQQLSWSAAWWDWQPLTQDIDKFKYHTYTYR